MKRQLANQVNSRHVRIVLLSTGGVQNHELARLVNCTPQWVRIIIHRFNAQGFDGISWYPFCADHTGQPRKFFAEIVEQIVELVPECQDPVALIFLARAGEPRVRATV